MRRGVSFVEVAATLVAFGTARVALDSGAVRQRALLAGAEAGLSAAGSLVPSASDAGALIEDGLARPGRGPWALALSPGALITEVQR